MARCSPQTRNQCIGSGKQCRHSLPRRERKSWFGPADRAPCRLVDSRAYVSRLYQRDQGIGSVLLESDRHSRRLQTLDPREIDDDKHDVTMALAQLPTSTATDAAARSALLDEAAGGVEAAAADGDADVTAIGQRAGGADPRDTKRRHFHAQALSYLQAATDVGWFTKVKSLGECIHGKVELHRWRVKPQVPTADILWSSLNETAKKQTRQRRVC